MPTTIGLEKATNPFLRAPVLAERVGATVQPDYAAFDRVVPHPVYARQHWVSILNPSDATFRDVALSLIAEAHDRLAAARARHRVAQGSA